MDLSLVVSTIMLVSTLFYYYRMILLTEFTTEASLFNTLYAEYATPHMLDATRSVEDFYHETELSSQQIVCSSVEDRLWDRKFDHDWQRLLHWYQKLVYFHRMGLLHDRFFHEFPGASRVRHFVQHVEPFAINACALYQEPNCSAETFDYLRKLYDLPARQEVVCQDAEHEDGAAAVDQAPKEEL